MLKKFLISNTFLVLLIVGGLPIKAQVKAPKAEKIPKKLSIHNDVRIDNYYWLNKRENPKVIEHLKAENTYANAVLKHTEKLQKKLYGEIIGRIKQDDASVPYRLRGFYYYTRYEKGKEYPIYCRKKGNLDAKEEVILNVNEMAKGHSFYRAVGVRVSLDNKLLAFGEDTQGRRKFTIRFKEIATGNFLEDKIVQTTGGAYWANDNKTVFYVVKEEKTLRAYKILKHTLGSKEKDQEVFHEKDETFGTYVYKSKSEKYIIIGCYSTVSSEYHFLDANTPEGKFKVIQPRERDLEYDIAHFEDKFYIRTNYKAKNFKLVETSTTKTEKENWKDVIAHRDNVLVENMEIFKKHLVVEERKNGLPQLRIFNWQDKSDHYLNFGEATYTAWIGTNPEFDTENFRYNYSSLTTPSSVFDYDMKTRKKTLRKRQEVVGGFNPEEYHAERMYAIAKDGTKVPLSLVYKKSLKKKEGNPLLLYGYGSYGYSLDDYFSSVRLSLLDRGFIYAVAHVRGGQEMGRYWYEEGKILNKKNTFSDFVACAKHLLNNKYTSSDQLFANGGSAGGLLMGAVVNMAPEIFKGIVADVPFVDVVTTMLDDSIPLTTGEYDEWGNPNEKKYYEYIKSYSPYDNVEAKDYPAMLVTTGLHDSQVQYWEPAKWVAKLRELKTDKNILVLKTDMDSGHGGASGRFKRHKLTALTYAFILDLMKIKD